MKGHRCLGGYWSTDPSEFWYGGAHAVPLFRSCPKCHEKKLNDWNPTIAASIRRGAQAE